MGNKVAGVWDIRTPQALELMVSRMVKQAKPVALDVETTGLNPHKDKLVMLQVAQEDGESFYVDLRHQGPASLHVIGSILSPLINWGGVLLGANISFDLGFLWVQCGLALTNPFGMTTHIHDVMLAELIIQGVGLSESHGSQNFTLKTLAKKYAGTELNKEDRNWFIDLDQRIEEWEAPIPEVQVVYGMQDVLTLFEIYHAQKAKIDKYNLDDTLVLDMMTIAPVVGMETVGVPVDEAQWRQVIEDTKQAADQLKRELEAVLTYPLLSKRTQEYDDKLREYEEYQRAKEAYLETVRKEYDDYNAGVKWGEYKLNRMRAYKETHPPIAKPQPPKPEINLSSGLQLKEALNAMQLESGRKEPLVFESVREAALEIYAARHPVIEQLIQWKKLDKLVVGFGDNLMAMVQNGRLYPHYNIIGAGTGRMSSYKPNFQQIPARSEIGGKLRECIRPREGYKMVACDFSNIELRILAEVSNDTNLLKAFASGEDVHSAMARLIFKLPKSVDPKKTNATINGKVLDTNYRNIAKTVTYAVLYGAGPSKLASVIKGSLDEAKDISAQYFAMFSGIKAWKDAQAEKVTRGVTLGKRIVASRTLGGRRRPNVLPVPPVPAQGKSTQASRDDYETSKQEYNKRMSQIKRKMVNSVIQGTSADITKLALAMWHDRHGYDDTMRLVAVIHDELLLEVREDLAETAKADLAEVMHVAMTTYLHKVDCPMPDGVVADHWMH